MDDAEAAVATIESLIAAFGHVFVPLTICAISFTLTRVSWIGLDGIKQALRICSKARQLENPRHAVREWVLQVRAD